MSLVDDTDIPETGAVFTFGKSSFAENLPNKFWVKNDRVLQISCGDEHTALVAESGRVFMFGSNSWGQLGLEQIKTANKPYCIKCLKREKVTLIACGRSHTVAATESGTLYTFGSNSEGQLGVEDVQDCSVPMCVENVAEMSYKMLDAGAEHSVALTEDGQVFVWGSNGEGQLGLGEAEGCSTPTKLEFDENIIYIACGYYHTAVVTEAGDLYTFGENDSGKLGLSHKNNVNEPEQVSSIPEKVKAVSCGGSHTAALTENGTVYTCGDGSNGQLGLGTMVMETATPQQVKMTPTVTQVICGENFTAIITERGYLYTFGDGRHGKLAQGTECFTNLYKPTRCDCLMRCFVDRVACGGCHMIVTANPRQQNGHIEDSEEYEEERSQLEHTMKGDNLMDLSLSARVRRRNTFNKNTCNRNLPSLGHNRSLPLHTTYPEQTTEPVTVDNHISKTMMPSIDLQKSSVQKAKFKDDSDSEEDESENEQAKEIKPKPLPRQKAVTKDLDSEGKNSDKSESESEEEENIDESEVRQMGTPKASPRSKKDSQSENEEPEKQEIQKEETVREETIREETAKETKTDKQKSPKKAKANIFGKKNVLDEKSDDEDEEEADDEDEEDEDEEEDDEEEKLKAKREKEEREKEEMKKKEKEKEKEKERLAKEEKQKGKKKKDKKEKKKEEEETREKEEEETKSKKTKRKVKKTKTKKKEENESDEDKEEDKNENREDKNEDKEEKSENKDEKEEEDKKEDVKEKETTPPKKKSRFCTIL